ncbi:GGDEF domain-containing protein [Vallicoccus soli]|uniref:GGDEF domain-containing protein n=1 Tax=Vallicoccus soli TaxID=2339232 RepID=UPI001401DB9B|nr:sensor domain-containing diguanylate cyclase [Vallicoccus soli]
MGDERAGAAGLPPRALAGLVALSQALAQQLSPDDLLLACARAGREALGAATVSVSRWDRELGLVRTLVNDGELADGEVPLPLDEAYPVAEYPVLTGFAQHGHGWTTAEDDPALTPAERAHLGARGRPYVLGAPVVLQGHAWGELYASRRRDQPRWGEDDVSLAGLVAELVATGLLRAGELERVSRLAYSDPLTGLANRRALDEAAEAAVARHRGAGVPVGVVLCDVNNLKVVNDRDGHEVGDELIVAFSEQLSAAASRVPGALAARLGGDEFCLLVEGAVPDAVVALAEDVAAAARSLPGGYGVSVGVACVPDAVGPVESARRLLRLADAAQYRAKRAGSRHAVVAGRPLPLGTAPALPAVPEIEPGVPERRRVFARSQADAGAVLAAATGALDRHRGAGAQERLEVVAGTLAGALDAAGWCVVRAPADGPPAPVALSPGSERLVLPLTADRPAGAAALAGGGATVLTGSPSNDPVLDARLVAAGAAAVVVAGGPERGRDGGGWLLEVVTDEVSAGVQGLAPAVRALVSLAVHG